MKKDFQPKTLPGKWALRFGMILAIAAALSVLFAIAIGGDPAVIADSLLLAIIANILSVIFTLAGPLSFFVGIFAIIKHKDWSVLKSLAILYALTLFLFLLGEFLFPH